MSWRRYATGRALKIYLGLWLAVMIALLLPFVVVLPVQLLWGQPTRWTPLWEALPALLGASAGALMAPGLASWERLGAPRLRPPAALTALIALLLPTIAPWLAHFRLPADARWVDIMCNVAAITAISLLATATVGRLYGTLVAYGTYVGLVFFQHAAPQLAVHVPFSGVIGNLRPHLWPTLALTATALAVWTWTLGTSLRERLLVHDDH